MEGVSQASRQLLGHGFIKQRDASQKETVFATRRAQFQMYHSGKVSLTVQHLVLHFFFF